MNCLFEETLAMAYTIRKEMAGEPEIEFYTRQIFVNIDKDQGKLDEKDGSQFKRNDFLMGPIRVGIVDGWMG